MALSPCVRELLGLALLPVEKEGTFPFRSKLIATRIPRNNFLGCGLLVRSTQRP